MNLAFCIYNYFPTGGLQQDFMNLIKTCLSSGHQVSVYTTEWQGSIDDAIALYLIKTLKLSNHQRLKDFARQCHSHFRDNKYDLIVGFNKMPGLDVYFAGDDCYQTILRQKHGRWYAFTPRARTYSKLEQTVFSNKVNTRILYIAPKQRTHYYQHYHIPIERFHALPPGCQIDNNPMTAKKALALRQHHGLKPNTFVILFVASHFKTKGLDRLLKALASLPNHLSQHTHCLIVGSNKTEPFLQLAKHLAVKVPLTWLGPQSELASYYTAADLLVHPAYHEAAGKVLLEAMYYATAVLTTDVCGYAPFVKKAAAGNVLAEPFDQNTLNSTLFTMLNRKRLSKWQTSAQTFSVQQDYCSMHSTALAHLETILQLKTNAPSSITSNLQMTSTIPKALKQWLLQLPNLQSVFHIKGEIFREVPDRRTLKFTHLKQNYFIKLHLGIGWHEIIKNLLHFRKPILSARNEWYATHYLETLDIPTTPPLCYGQIGNHPAHQQSFLITQPLNKLICLDQILEIWNKQRPNLLVRRSWINRVATIMRTMHQAGMSHSDCYLCHFAVHTNLDGNRMLPISSPMYLMDLHRAQIQATLSKRWRAKDLAGLAFSSANSILNRKDRLYFIQCYHQQRLAVCLKKHKRLWQWVIYKSKLMG